MARSVLGHLLGHDGLDRTVGWKGGFSGSVVIAQSSCVHRGVCVRETVCEGMCVQICTQVCVQGWDVGTSEGESGRPP